MILRDYQKEALDVMNDFFNKGNNNFVLAACPSAGKTFITLKYIEQTPGRFLILTHGQNVLLDMWKNEIERYFKKEDKNRIVFGLPQSLSKKELGKFDYIVVDEAHEFTFAKGANGKEGMVQKILKKCPDATRVS